MGRRAKQQVHSITGVPRSLSDDVHHREVRYVISMAIRTLCLVLAVVVPYWPLRAVFLLAAIFLPYVAVVAANAGRETVVAPPVPGPGPGPRGALGPGEHSPGPESQPPEGN